MQISYGLKAFINEYNNNYEWYNVFDNFKEFVYSKNIKQSHPKTYKKYFDGCDYLKSDTDGYLSYDKGKQKVKLGKLIATISKKDLGRNLINDDLKIIEKIVNSFKAWQNKNGELKFVELKGRNIVYKGYNKKRCVKRLNSCMTNKFSYLKLYSKNKNKISLLVLKNKEGKICARALIWKMDLPNDVTFMDRIYYTKEFHRSLYEDYAKEKGWVYESSSMKLEVKLNTKFVFKYPYMDTMIYKTKNNIFTNKYEEYVSRYKMRSTGGRIYTLNNY